MENSSIINIGLALERDSVPHCMPASDADIISFSNRTGLLIPDDLSAYFMSLNGMSEYDSNLFRLYSLDEFITVKSELGDWIGPPDYRKIVIHLKEHENIYVVADYNYHLFTYAIKLSKKESSRNELYALCGEEFRVIASSFNGFLDLYLRQDQSLLF